MKTNLIVTAALSLSLCAASTAQTLPAYLPADGLVGWWPFNGNANDESGNGNDGTVNGATLTEDKSGTSEKAYAFSQTNDYLTLPGVVTNSISDAMSVSLWAKHQTLDASGYIFDKAALPGNYDRATLLHWGTDLRVYNENSFYSSYPNVIDTNWHHYLMILNGNEVILFIDGVSSGIGTLGYNFLNTPGIITLGKANNSILDNYSGNIDDIAIYNRALSQEEITALFTGEPVNPTTACNPLPSNLQNGLVGYWPFCGNAIDESGNGNDGTVNGATLTEDRFGVANAAYDFDGDQDFIVVANEANFDFQTEFTINTWLRLNSINQGQKFIVTKFQDYDDSYALFTSNNLITAQLAAAPTQWTEFMGTTELDSLSWVNITLVLSNQNLKLFLNGMEEASSPYIDNVFNSQAPVVFGDFLEIILSKEPLSMAPSTTSAYGTAPSHPKKYSNSTHSMPAPLPFTIPLPLRKQYTIR